MDEEIKNEETQEEAQEPVKDEAGEEIAEKSEKKAPEETQEKPLDKMTVKELREIALGIPSLSGVHAMKKEELLAAIKEDRGIVDEAPAKKKKAAPGKELTVKDLKKKIAELLEEKRELPAETDRKKKNILRRRINRLKKQTRRVA